MWGLFPTNIKWERMLGSQSENFVDQLVAVLYEMSTCQMQLMDMVRIRVLGPF